MTESIGSSGRRWLQRAVPLLVSALALAALFMSVDDPAAVGAALSWKVALVMLPAMLAYGAVTLALEAFSLRLLIANPPSDFGLWTAAKIKCASYLLAIVHYALGVGALTVLLRRRARLPLGEASSVVLLVSFTDLLVVLLLAAGFSSMIELPTGSEWVRMPVLVVAVVGFFGGLALLRTRYPLGPLERLRELPVFAAVRHLPLVKLVQLLLMRLAFSLFFIAATGAAFVAFDLWPGFPRLAVGAMLVALVSALPIAVAGLGTGQVAFVELFAGVADRETLLASSLVLSLSMIALRVGMGLLFAREFTREAMAHTDDDGP